MPLHLPVLEFPTSYMSIALTQGQVCARGPYGYCEQFGENANVEKG